MRKIAVTGGKGGVGKSTIACLLANDYLSQGQRVLLVDLDVECPNDYLLLGQRLGKPIDRTYANFPVLDRDKCQKCGQCVEICKENAIFQIPGEYPQFFKNLCSACGACSIACPNQAIKRKKEEIGRIYQNKVGRDYYLITGEARAGLEETGPVVLKTKKRALKIAQEKDLEIVIFDTAAGLHCPVISALLEIDLAYLVTEPTPLGIHDLRLILQLTKKLRLKAKIIINQSDLGPNGRIEKIAKDNQAPISSRIPFSKKIVSLYSQGELVELSLKEAE